MKKPIKSDGPVLSFTVKLSKWRCGGSGKKTCRLGTGDTALRTYDGFYCCLGFAAHAANKGIRLGIAATPSDLNRVLPGLTQQLNDGQIINSPFSKAAMTVNDAERLTIAKKQERLIALGKKHNIEVKFAP